MSEVEKAKFAADLTEKCVQLCEQCSMHLDQFPTAALDLASDEKEIRDAWLQRYCDINEEQVRLDRYSCGDLVFATLCYARVAINPRIRTQEPGVNPQSILEALRYIGCQHTPSTIQFQTEPEFISRLWDAVAYVVVYQLSAVLPARNKYSDIDKISWMPAQIVKGLSTIHQFAEPPKNDKGEYVRQVEVGQWWNEAMRPEALFLNQASRTLQCIEFEAQLLKRVPVIEFSAFDNSSSSNTSACGAAAASSSSSYDPTPSDLPVLLNPAALKVRFQKWLLDACKIDTSDDFASEFRSAVFEMLLPVNSRLNAMTRRKGSSSGTVFPLTLLQFELGFDVANTLSEGFGHRVRSIGYDPKHPYYNFMALFMFGYVMFHEQRVNFIQQFFIKNCDLYKSRDRIHTSLKFKRLREPLILYIQRRAYVHFFTDKDHGYFVRCADTIEACLLWLHLLVHYQKGLLITGHNLTDWSGQFLDLTRKIDTGEEDDDDE